jgi:hypothetical protein
MPGGSPDPDRLAGLAAPAVLPAGAVVVGDSSSGASVA